MIAKMFEIRDTGTFIPVLAVKLTPANEAERFLLARAGYGLTPAKQSAYIVLVQVNGGCGKATCDPHDWPTITGNTRTMIVAHRWLIEHFDGAQSGAVIDVEFILGITAAPKVSEQAMGGL